MATDDDVLFIRGNGDTSAEDIWDDSALIKAYDKAINLAKEEVSKRLGLDGEISGKQKNKSQKQSGQLKKSQKKWFIGSPCRAIYSEDGELYEAVIIKLFENTGTCIVKFIGYNNKEKVELSSLIESEGLQSQIAQQKEAALLDSSSNSVDHEESHKANRPPDSSMDYDTQEPKTFNNIYPPESSYSGLGAMPPAPPLPPQLMARLPENDADALSSMLMSWYISGFHTGYYHGLKQAQSSQGHKRK